MTTHDSKISELSKAKPYAYKDFDMASVTKKARFRELFTEHFEKARKATKGWKGKIDHNIEKERKKTNKQLEVAEFVEVNMQTAIRVSYDHTKRLDENLKEYTDQKERQDESDQVNFLRQPAAGKTMDTAHEQSMFWYNMRRGFGNGIKVWRPSKFRMDTGPGGKTKKPSIPIQEV